MSDTPGATGRRTAVAGAPFVTTCWTMVMAAAAPDAPDAREAFGNLYRDYWPALYGYVRRRGHGPAAAEDITQDFFFNLLEKQRLKRISPDGGRFRSFLLTALKNHLANEWDRSRAARRGGGTCILPLDEAAAEAAFQQCESNVSPPEQFFDRQWALTVLDLARRRFEAELTAAGKSAWLETLGSSLLSGVEDHARGEQAARLGMTEGALKVAIHRLRKRFGELLREEVARTVEDPAGVAGELRYLIETVGQSG